MAIPGFDLGTPVGAPSGAAGGPRHRSDDQRRPDGHPVEHRVTLPRPVEDARYTPDALTGDERCGEVGVSGLHSVATWPGTARNWWRRERPADLRETRSEALVAVPRAIGSVPDGMAASVLTGVNPIHGLYASFAG